MTLAPLDFKSDFPQTPAIVDRKYAPPSLSLRQIERPVRRTVGSLDVEVRPQPLTLVVRNRAGKLLQRLVFEPDGSLSFQLDDQPVLGMGEGGPRPVSGRPWREQPVQFDRRGPWTRWSRAGRATCTAHEILSRCCSVRLDGASSSPRRGCKRTSRIEIAVCSFRGSPQSPRACRRRSATSSRTWARAFLRSAASFLGSTTSSCSTRTTRSRP